MYKDIIKKRIQSTTQIESKEVIESIYTIIDYFRIHTKYNGETIEKHVIDLVKNVQYGNLEYEHLKMQAITADMLPMLSEKHSEIDSIKNYGKNL